jgi:hypothetical protein
MQRRIKAQPPDTAAYQALIDHKQATLNVLLSRIPEIRAVRRRSAVTENTRHDLVLHHVANSPADDSPANRLGTGQTTIDKG